MSLSIWDLFKYLFKWKIAIAIVTLMAFLAATWYVDNHQTYTSKVIIQYTDSCISEGKTLDGGVFDSNEIKSPTVILNVLKDLGYSNKKIDSVREHISISPITPTTVNNLKTAKEKLGEEYTFYPKTFMITYKGNSSFEATRDTLSSVVANYFKYYSENYLYMASLNEVDYSVNKKNFDYLEQAEQIKENMEQAITALSNYSRDSRGYRSPTTGLTFDDLLKDFERIDEFSLSLIFSKIFEGQVSVDEKLLIDKYTERLENNKREVDNLTYKTRLSEDRMNAYVGANVDVPNSYNDNINDGSDNIEIINEVEWDSLGEVDEQTTYDSLIINYANDSIAANNKEIDAQYCASVIERFSKARDESINYAEYEQDVKNEIDEVLTSLYELYRKANINISDYNSYIPALHLKKLSGVGYYENMSGSLYKLIAIIGGFSMSCVAAIAFEIMKKYAAYSAEEGTASEDGEVLEINENNDVIKEDEDEENESGTEDGEE